jgi:hypothetical protein
MMDPMQRTATRDESEHERLDRNWVELLQEVRVVQTGVQLLTGFLLILPFQDKFDRLSDDSTALYLVALGLSAASTTCLITPVAMHRVLFRHGARPMLVASAQRYALAGLAMLALAIVAVLTLVFGIVVSRSWGIVTGCVSGVLFATAWLAVPLVLRRRLRASPLGADSAAVL